MGSQIQREDSQRKVPSAGEGVVEEKHYRIISEPSWQVQGNYKGNWHTVYYCSGEDSAKRCLVECEKRRAKWLTMTKEERMKAILR